MKKQIRINNIIRVFLFFSLLSFVCGLICGCFQKSELTQEQILMGSNARITIVPDSKEAQLAISRAFALLQEYEAKFSFYNSESELSTINNKAAQKPVKVSSEMFDILEMSLAYSRQTKGVFDPTATSLQIKDGYGNIVLNKKDQTVYLKDSQAKIDLGGIAVGFCIDSVVSGFHKAGINNFLIDLGGDIYAQGKNKQDKPWGIGVRDPFNKDNILEKIFITRQAVTTSGNYIKNHIISTVNTTNNQNTKNKILSVTVIADKCIDADVLATAFFVMGVEKTKLFLENKKKIKVIFVVQEQAFPKIIKINS